MQTLLLFKHKVTWKPVLKSRFYMFQYNTPNLHPNQHIQPNTFIPTNISIPTYPSQHIRPNISIPTYPSHHPNMSIRNGNCVLEACWFLLSNTPNLIKREREKEKKGKSEKRKRKFTSVSFYFNLFSFCSLHKIF